MYSEDSQEVNWQSIINEGKETSASTEESVAFYSVEANEFYFSSAEVNGDE